MDGTKYDLRKDTLLTEQPFDDAWTDLEHAEDGTVTAVFTRPDGKKVRVGGDETVTSFQVCTGTGFPAIKHPAGVAVEPQTAIRERVQHRQGPHRHQAGRDVKHGAVHRDARLI